MLDRTRCGYHSPGFQRVEGDTDSLLVRDGSNVWLKSASRSYLDVVVLDLGGKCAQDESEIIHVLVVRALPA